MRPILIVTGDFVKTGGMDRCNYALARHYAERGRELHLVGYRAAPDLLAFPNVVWHRVPKVLNSYFLSEPLLDRAGRWWGRRLAQRGARVVVNGANCAFPDVNWVLHVHAADGAHPGGPWHRRLRQRLYYRHHCRREARILPRARLLVTECERNRHELARLFGPAGSAAHVVYPGVDPQRFRPATPDERRRTRAAMGWDGRPLVGFVGALANRRKGFDVLFEAWRRLCDDRHWDADLVVMGRGAEQPEWQARARAEGLAGRVHFLGFVADLPTMLAACDAHVLPSRYEGYSLATQEALCCGLPALVSASAGIAERYPAALGELLIPDPEDVAGLAQRLRRWHARRDELRSAVAGFTDVLRAHTWDAMAGQMAGLIDEAA
jgi:glycosyltransferase involved in cell wall biosynthesis